MKNIALILFAMAIVSNGFSQELAASGVKQSTEANFSWSETSHDFGKTKVGVPVSYEFRFKNTGLMPLIISSVKASCGCTVTAYTKEPVEHGGSGFVRATYDAATVGVYNKTLAVSSNTPGGILHLTVKGEIVK